MLFVVLLSGCASSGVSGPFSLVPPEGGQAQFFREGLSLSTRHMDEREGMGYLRARGFEALSEEMGKLPLTVFLLRVANDSSKEAIIDPAGTRFVTGTGRLASLMTYAHFYTDLPPGPSREEVLRGFQAVSLDRMEKVPPGGKLERILFFRRPEKVGEEAGILFGSLFLGGKQVDQAFIPLKAVPREE